MKTFLSLFLLLCALTMSATAGGITGTVRAEGKDGASGSGDGGKYDSHKFKFAERVDYEALRDFIIYIEGPVGTNTTAIPDKPVQVVMSRKVAQRGAMFAPHVMPVVAGTTVEWPNYDDIYHNVFSMSETKEFDLGLYKAPEVKRVTFDKSGRVDVFCSIHASMNCIILVLENPFFSVADGNGRYSITNIPPGTYKLKAWHERLPAQTKEITVPETGEAHVDFTMGIKGLPKY